MRKWLETVMDWPSIRVRRDYAMQVAGIKREGKQIEVLLEFLEPEQLGRRMPEVLELPIRPAGLTAAFFAACGQEVCAGRKLSPRDCLGKTLTVQWVKQDEKWRAMHFVWFSHFLGNNR